MFRGIRLTGVTAIPSNNVEFRVFIRALAVGFVEGHLPLRDLFFTQTASILLRGFALILLVGDHIGDQLLVARLVFSNEHNALSNGGVFRQHRLNFS